MNDVNCVNETGQNNPETLLYQYHQYKLITCRYLALVYGHTSFSIEVLNENVTSPRGSFRMRNLIEVLELGLHEETLDYAMYPISLSVLCLPFHCFNGTHECTVK